MKQPISKTEIPCADKRNQQYSISINKKVDINISIICYLLKDIEAQNYYYNNYHEINGRENLIQKGETHFDPEQQVRIKQAGEP